MIRVQTEDFHLQTEYEALQQSGHSGAIVTFIGSVRDFTGLGTTEDNATFRLDHYPGMTEKVLEKIELQAKARWDLIATTIIHRVGELKAGDQIVLVGASSRHRKNAFEACEFMMDILKTQAPFWKKEGHHWVDAKESDNEAANRWLID